jgi:cytochrome bd-type quinol oxidase subunit 1
LKYQGLELIWESFFIPLTLGLYYKLKESSFETASIFWNFKVVFIIIIFIILILIFIDIYIKKQRFKNFKNFFSIVSHILFLVFLISYYFLLGNIEAYYHEYVTAI